MPYLSYGGICCAEIVVVVIDATVASFSSTYCDSIRLMRTRRSDLRSRGTGSNGTENRHKPSAAQIRWAYSRHLLEHFVAKGMRFAPMFSDATTGGNPAPDLGSHKLRLLRHFPGGAEVKGDSHQIDVEQRARR